MVIEQERDGETNRIKELILTTIDSGRSRVLTTDASQATRLALEQWMMKNGKDGLYAGNCIADRLGMKAANVMSLRRLGGLIATGGDIAYRTCEYLQVNALCISDEVEEGIPLSRIIGGQAEGLPIVTKAGAFGNRLSLVRAAEKIKTYKQG